MHIFRRWFTQPFQGVVQRKKIATPLERFSYLFICIFCTDLASDLRIQTSITSVLLNLGAHKHKESEKEEEEERKRQRGKKVKREWQKTAISCSLVLREHIYCSLISNALINFLSLFIACMCDLSLATCRKKEKFQNGYFRESITQLLHILCFMSAI